MKKLLSCLLIETYKISDFVTDVEYNTSSNPQKASHSHSWKLYKTYQPRKKHPISWRMPATLPKGDRLLRILHLTLRQLQCNYVQV